MKPRTLHNGPDLRRELVKIGRLLYSRGMLDGTSGNLSARNRDGSIWITKSGISKGNLTTDSFLHVNRDGQLKGKRAVNCRPSHETCLHWTLYELFETARSCLHVHTIASNLAAYLDEKACIRLPRNEMLKGFGRRSDDEDCSISVFLNHSDPKAIAENIRNQFGSEPPVLPVLMIRDHGLFIWGGSPQEALNHLELTDFLLRVLVLGRLGNLL